MKKIIISIFIFGFSLSSLHAQQAPRPLPAHIQQMDAATKLGWMYYRGIGTKPNYKKAFYWFEKGALNGSEQALFFRASMLQRGRGVKKDEKRAFAILYDLAHKYANPHAAFKLSIAYEKGIGCEPDPAQSQRWLDFAATNGIPPAQLKKGLSLIEKQPVVGAKWVEQAATRSHFRWANYQLALLYAAGTGVTQNPQKALETILPPAQQNLAPAQWQLSQWYEQGFGTETNLQYAFDWALKAAQNGIKEAQLKVANYYRNGTGTSVNTKQAKYWEKQAQKIGQNKKREEFY